MIAPGGRERLGDGRVELGEGVALGVGEFWRRRCAGGECEVNADLEHTLFVEREQFGEQVGQVLAHVGAEL